MMEKPSKLEALRRFGASYRADAAVRARVGSGDYSDLDLELPEGCEVRVLEQSPDVHYFLLPPKPDRMLSEEALDAVAGGSSRGGCYSDGSMACTCVMQSDLFGRG